MPVQDPCDEAAVHLIDGYGHKGPPRSLSDLQMRGGNPVLGILTDEALNQRRRDVGCFKVSDSGICH
jgi:hypothetical protein